MRSLAVVAENPAVPLGVRVLLAHAAVQVTATHHGVDLLHIKGPAVAPGLRTTSSNSTDADVLVRPAHVSRFMRALRRAGWQLQTGFSQGSAFEHAAGLYHPNWGLLDVHRRYPGLDRDPGLTFDRLWTDRLDVDLASVPCPVPERTAQALILLLHAARSGGVRGPTGHPDHASVWVEATEEERAAIRRLAATLEADVGLAAATGRLDEHAHHPEAAIWRLFSEDHSRLDEWRARVGVAPSWRGKVTVVARSFLVNRYFLEQSLGRPASHLDVGREFARRLGHGGRDLVTLARRRDRSTR